ncbi:hypothetical protein M9H77_24420 [Catharanthus roseus]|uniref:Uncharacterized protein n=1 Tax=Catharanthus roseus TaxID=4058 RepID=A0ACC0AVN7_CATRO|nr:hypothetical protein M9H77_24420 [Catharanthus roseus]
MTWSYNTTFQQGTDSSYKTIKVKLFYARISQVDRARRKALHSLEKDKTCQFKIEARPCKRDIPTATYFVRAYAYAFADEKVVFEQSTEAHKTKSLVKFEAIFSRYTSIDIAATYLSTFSIVSLFGFFYLEKRKAKSIQQR